MAAKQTDHSLFTSIMPLTDGENNAGARFLEERFGRKDLSIDRDAGDAPRPETAAG